MNIKDFRIEYRKNPVGLDVRKPRFSWKIVSEEKNVLQTAYRITVEQQGTVIWDTGKRESSDSVLIPYEGMELDACSFYEVQMEVWDTKEIRL